jgi:predicted GNAT superfamily acetyltransferase
MTLDTGLDPDRLLARQAADAAARTAGVSVRELSGLHDMDDVVALFNSIWGQGRPPVSVELLRALDKAGNYVTGAFAEGTLVGASVGFFHSPSEDALHSHIAGVMRGLTGRSIGRALKLHQRSWALERGVTGIVWTFDPLLARNAYFNLAKLGARAQEYLPNFYGPMADDINGDDDSDRLLVHWRLRDPKVAAAAAGHIVPVATSGAVLALDRDDAGAPRPGSGDGDLVLVAAPTDIGRLRATDPGLAREWRIRIRETLGGLLAEGARVTGFDRDGWYVVAREGAGAEGDDA